MKACERPTHLTPILHVVSVVDVLGYCRYRASRVPDEEGTSEMNANSTRNVVVESGGTQVVGHVGLHALGMFADRLGVGEALSQAVGWSGSGTPVHDRGRVLTQAKLMLAGGGESCTDIEAFKSQGRLFGTVWTSCQRPHTETRTGG